MFQNNIKSKKKQFREKDEKLLAYIAETILDSLCHICNGHMGGLNRVKRKIKNVNRRWPEMDEKHNFKLFWNKNILDKFS